MTGTISSIRSEKGFCFVKNHDGSGDAFLHAKECRGQMLKWNEGDILEYDVVQTDRGPRAQRAILIQDATE